jgi:hypothetical protein
MAEWRPIAGRPGFEVNATGRVRRTPIPQYRLESIEDLSVTHEQILDKMAELAHQTPPEDEEDKDEDEDTQGAPSADPTHQHPPGWLKGQLLNVRNRGEYVVTLLGEEDEPPLRPAPSGVLRFSNSAKCQEFISRWYARESYDPRAR